MRIKNFFKHTGIVLAGVLLLLGIPFVTTDYFKTIVNGDVDAVSSASVIINQPSGEYIVLLNRELHTNEENLTTWIQFFRGEEISYLFEDISCSVIKGDTGALTMAQSFQSRLPEKQMSIQTEDASLLMSRADNGQYDIIIISKEYAESYDVTTVEGENTTLINIISERNEE
jgi:galactitol-specific phosphotransferase system IIB component